MWSPFKADQLERHREQFGRFATSLPPGQSPSPGISLTAATCSLCCCLHGLLEIEKTLQKQIWPNSGWVGMNFVTPEKDNSENLIILELFFLLTGYFVPSEMKEESTFYFQ